MSDSDQAFREMLQEIAAGSEEAARRFLEEYGAYILSVIRRRLHDKLRSKFDSQDFLQDVCLSFFRAPPPPEIFTDPKSLLNYLAKLARDKVFATVRHRMWLPTHNVTREQSLDGSACKVAHAKAGADPTPSHVAGLNEQFAVVDEEFPVPVRLTFRLLRLNYSHEEIARYLGTNTRQIRRYVKLLRARFQR